MNAPPMFELAPRWTADGSAELSEEERAFRQRRIRNDAELEDAIEAALQNPDFQCHLRETWNDSDPFVAVFERQGEWPRLQHRLREWRVDLAKLGLELANG